MSFEMYIFPERQREGWGGLCEHSYVMHVDRNVLKSDCVNIVHCSSDLLVKGEQTA